MGAQQLFIKVLLSAHNPPRFFLTLIFFTPLFLSLHPHTSPPYSFFLSLSPLPLLDIPLYVSRIGQINKDCTEKHTLKMETHPLFTFSQKLRSRSIESCAEGKERHREGGSSPPDGGVGRSTPPSPPSCQGRSTAMLDIASPSSTSSDSLSFHPGHTGSGGGCITRAHTDASAFFG